MKDETIEKIAQVVASGGTLLYPTDTIWGIGCDAANAVAVDKLYALKQRDYGKSMLILCSDIAMVERYVGTVEALVRQQLLFADRPTTVIIPVAQSLLAGNLLAQDGTVGVRIPRMEFCQRLLQALGRPLVSTSANFSGHPSPASYADIEPALLRLVDCVVPTEWEEPSGGKASRIVKVQPDGSVAIIRE